MNSAPSIVTTAPTDAVESATKQGGASYLSKRRQKPEYHHPLTAGPSRSSLPEQSLRTAETSNKAGAVDGSARESRITFDEPEKFRGLISPPPYGDESNSSLALPFARLSESSRSDGSLGDPVYATTTTHTVSTTTTFFRLPRRKKNKGPLFPLPVKIPAPDQRTATASTPRPSIAGQASGSPRRRSLSKTRPDSVVASPDARSDANDSPSALHPSAHFLSTAARKDSAASAPPNESSHSNNSPVRLGKPTGSKMSLRQAVDDDLTPPSPHPQSGRTSSSTGRTSLGGFFNMSRVRQNSEPQQLRHTSSHPPHPGTPMSAGSKSHSFNLSREPPKIPERQEGDTPAKYLIRLEEAVSRGLIATVLSQSNDDFYRNVLRSYMRGFKFFGDPLDMSTRKLLMEVELPRETQQIDRVLQAFANRYHECNPGIYASPDEAYFIAFSILILHTDVFNKNNKNKMQKHDYTKNARGQGVADEILQCFYDNISYTPFIHVEDDLELSGDRIGGGKLRKSMFTKQSMDSAGRPSREPVDPYTLILDNRLDSLRPSLKDVMNLDDYYTYQGSGTAFNLLDLHKTFFKYGVLQILSSRSRPEAFMSPETMANPAEAHPGVVDIKVTKVGILWRKDAKKKKTRSPWQEWGAILTGAQLYFFRNVAWVKALMHQHSTHLKQGPKNTPVVFKPPLEQFKPDVLMSTEDAVALQDISYKKHKNSILFVRHGGLEEIFLADSESEFNDWLAKLNYAAAFRTAGVRIRGLTGGGAETPQALAIHRMDSERTNRSLGSSSVDNAGQIPGHEYVLAQQVQIARRHIMAQKISEGDEHLKEATQHLETHLRNARHLQILAPIQNRTREQLILAAGAMSAKIKWTRIDIWRTRCHRDILGMDLDNDVLGEGLDKSLIQSSLQAIAPPHHLSRRDESRESTGSPSQIGRALDGQPRPVTQPSPAKSFSMDDVFESLQRSAGSGSHNPKGSWELPPLSFQQTRASFKSNSSHGQTHHIGSPQSSPRSASDRGMQADLGAPITVAPVNVTHEKEQEVLLEAAYSEDVPPDGTRPATPPQGRDGEGASFRSPASEGVEGKSKVRRSLQRTLRDSAHGSSHHRSRKGKDSAGSAVVGDQSLPQQENEGLARSTGSFTVHGKKASVIKFGSEWQGISPEERLKLQRDARSDGSKLSVPSAAEDEVSSLRSASNPWPRPVSSLSYSTTTSGTAAFEEASEEPAQAIESGNVQS